MKLFKISHKYFFVSFSFRQNEIQLQLLGAQKLSTNCVLEVSKWRSYLWKLDDKFIKRGIIVSVKFRMSVRAIRKIILRKNLHFMFLMQEVGSDFKLCFYKFLLFGKKNQRRKAGTAKLQLQVLVPDHISYRRKEFLNLLPSRSPWGGE